MSARVSLLDEHGGFGECWDHPCTHYVDDPDAPSESSLRRRRYGRGTGEPSVDADGVAGALRAAVDGGRTPREVADGAGVGYGTVYRLVHGRQRRVRASTDGRLRAWIAAEGLSAHVTGTE